MILNLTLFQFTTPFTYGDGDDWLTFWGNYSGGLVSAIVAYIVANSQIQKQQKLDLAKEKYARTINQLPALVRIKIEIEKYIKELQSVKEEREAFLQRNGGIRQKSYEYSSPEEFIVSPDEGVPEFEITEKHYDMELPQLDSFVYLEKVEDINLQIDLITCFNFYRDFSEAMNYNMVLADKERNELNDSLKGMVADGQLSKFQIIQEKVGLMYRETNIYYGRKKSGWKTFYEKDMLGKFMEVLNRLDDEITTVKQIKKTGDMSLLDKVGS
ncbi:hypothetical protein [Cytobacillus firmus]|uniref:hypothetical protein n=1 Tax=Cytobacillus firmus TaxID=1399 RepID=UPI0018CCC972|nr:hypothetical protein [Cytobacillus firmus]MBG9656581.1 hypothetical protein [Cytobacillus firmus]MED1909086.1 hypothetical protein [Cytobacillus firmus]